MTKIDYDKVTKKIIEQGYNNVVLSQLGYVITDSTLCEYNAISILSHMNNVTDKLSDIQSEKLLEMYNFLILS